jgi:hypothetical protein
MDCRLPSSSVPPWCSGAMWSTSMAKVSLFARRHGWQSPLSRRRMRSLILTQALPRVRCVAVFGARLPILSMGTRDLRVVIRAMRNGVAATMHALVHWARRLMRHRAAERLPGRSGSGAAFSERPWRFFTKRPEASTRCGIGWLRPYRVRLATESSSHSRPLTPDQGAQLGSQNETGQREWGWPMGEKRGVECGRGVL